MEVEKKRRVNQEGEYNPQWWYYQGEPGEVNLPTVYTSGPKQIGGLRGKASHYRLEITLVQTQDRSIPNGTLVPIQCTAFAQK